jgi:hypothetical protein
MRYLSMIRIDENTGQLISTAGLRPPSEGVRVRLRRSKLTRTDGPFTETKEAIGAMQSWRQSPRTRRSG